MALISPFDGKTPSVAASAYVDISARLIGDVHIADEASIWPMAVIRADSESVRIGFRSAVLDLALIEAPEGLPVTIGQQVIVSHGAIIHGASLSDNVLVGMGAILLDGVQVGTGSIIGAGSLVTAGTRIDPFSLFLGNPLARSSISFPPMSVTGISATAPGGRRCSLRPPPTSSSTSRP